MAHMFMTVQMRETNGTFYNFDLTRFITETLMSCFGCNNMNGLDRVFVHWHMNLDIIWPITYFQQDIFLSWSYILEVTTTQKSHK